MEQVITSSSVWFNRIGRSPLVIVGLFFVALFESIFLPIPPDPFLLIAVALNRKQWVRLSMSVFLGSIIGAIIAFTLGRVLFDTFGTWLLGVYSLKDEFVLVQEQFQNNTFIAVLFSVLTPIPFKLLALGAGFVNASIFQFLVASVIARGTRFFLLGYITSLVGEALYSKVSKRAEIVFWTMFTIVFVSSIVYVLWHFIK